MLPFDPSILYSFLLHRGWSYQCSSQISVASLEFVHSSCIFHTRGTRVPVFLNSVSPPALCRTLSGQSAPWSPFLCGLPAGQSITAHNVKSYLLGVNWFNVSGIPGRGVVDTYV